MKNIVITGANGGVGSLLAKGLAQNGHHILCLGRREKPLKALVEDIKSQGGKASFVLADMMDDQMVMEAGQKMVNNQGHIDVWINNVGVNNHNAIGPTWTLKPEHWWTEVSLNLYTAFAGTRTAIKLMEPGNQGCIINLGGGGVQEPKPFGSAYGAAKTAVVKFTETVQIELEKSDLNIKVFAFNPGFIRNDRTEKLVESEVARTYMPKLEQILKYGEMSDIQDSINLIEAMIGGALDELGGRYFFADDKNVKALLANKADFHRAKSNLLRVKNGRCEYTEG